MQVDKKTLPTSLVFSLKHFWEFLFGRSPAFWRRGRTSSRQYPPLNKGTVITNKAYTSIVIGYIWYEYSLAFNSIVMDFAPYQDTTPESTRALSPPPNRALSPARNATSPPPNRPTTDPFAASSLPAPTHFSHGPRGNAGFGGERGNIEDGRLDVNLFETSLPLRLDYEAMLAYLLLPPAGGVFLLLVEHKSDYVRYVKSEEGDVLGTCLL